MPDGTGYAMGRGHVNIETWALFVLSLLCIFAAAILTNDIKVKNGRPTDIFGFTILAVLLVSSRTRDQLEFLPSALTDIYTLGRSLFLIPFDGGTASSCRRTVTAPGYIFSRSFKVDKLLRLLSRMQFEKSSIGSLPMKSVTASTIYSVRKFSRISLRDLHCHWICRYMIDPLFRSKHSLKWSFLDD